MVLGNEKGACDDWCEIKNPLKAWMIDGDLQHDHHIPVVRSKCGWNGLLMPRHMPLHTARVDLPNNAPRCQSLMGSQRSQRFQRSASQLYITHSQH